MSHESAELLRTLVNERHGQVRRDLDTLLDALATNDRVQVQAANAALSQSLTALGGVVARSDWPTWLSKTLHHSENYRTNHNNGIGTWKAHLLTLMKFRNDIENYNWFSGESEYSQFDLDDIISTAREENNIDGLFSNIIEALNAIITCAELDSVKATEDLQKIIDVLRRARKSSFTSQVVSWQFARRFIPNLISCYLKRSDITGPIIEAFEQTASELDSAFDAAKDQIGERLLAAATSGFRSDALNNIDAGELKALPNLTDGTKGRK